ncbi:amidohydrolase [Siminovitchia terrae]|uniref:amidohydrolase n=1 Tax=Siminovitchia terrae TaxID=1914933 RepID=UPI001B2F1F30|nr:amidohydrolase [Siminovitchia terrae]GIN91276.1 amidohydrolase [Siminovitchia terrae]
MGTNLKRICITSFIFILIFSLSACAGNEVSKDQDNNKDKNVANDDRNEADIVITNASVFTADEKGTSAQAVAIKDSLITYVGDNAGAEKLVGPDTSKIDAKGGTVMPGIVDSHMHPVYGAVAYLYEINLHEAFEKEAYLEVIKEFVEENPDMEVYAGSGFMRSSFDRVGPRKEDLDKISGDKPIILTSADGHSMWVNSKALEKAKVNKDTKNPTGGVIQRDPKTGEPSGLLQESAMQLVKDQEPDYTKEQYKEAILWVQEWFNEEGLTTVFDAIVSIDNDNYYNAYQELAEEGKLTMRVRGAWGMSPEMAKDIAGYEKYIDKAIEQSKEFTTDYFQINSFKFFADQVLEEETGYLLEPYNNSDDGWRGIKVWEDDTMEAIFTKIDKAGFQLHIHQIGDAAAKYSLDALEKVRETNGDSDSRHSFAHVQMLSDEDAKRMGDLKMNAVIAPYWFAMDDYYWELYVPYLGKERADNTYPVKSLLDKGVNLAIHSDFSVSEPDIGWLLYGAVKRTIPQRIHDMWYEGMDLTRTADPDEEVKAPNIGPLKPAKERLNIQEIMKASTYGGAYANFMEEETGSIEEGKKADLIMYDIDIEKADVEDVSNSAPQLTLFDGKIVFENNKE